MGKPAVTALGWQSGFCSGSVFEKAHLRIGDLGLLLCFFYKSMLTDPGLVSHDEASYLIFTLLFDA